LVKASAGMRKTASVRSTGKIDWTGPHNSGTYWRADTFPQFYLYRWKQGRKYSWWVQCDALNVYDELKARGIETAKKAAVAKIKERLTKLATHWNAEHTTSNE
jgi:hypothetical protein